MSKIHILIPARRNSKGIPFKNRKLFHHTVDKIRKEWISKVYVSTDDEWIKEECGKMKLNIHNRSADTATDGASTKSLVCEFIREKSIGYNDIIIMLYLTYPEREWQDVENALDFFIANRASSLLCKKEPQTHPFLCLVENGPYGKQLTNHNLYRRQDYPKMFEISHYISIFKVSEVNKLNNNLYNETTMFYPIADKIDVDLPEDLKKVSEKLDIKRDIPTPQIIQKPQPQSRNPKKFLILGNDVSLLDLKPEMIPSHCQTIGINRSWLHIKSNFLFFNDYDIIRELIRDKVDMTDLNCYTTSSIFQNAKPEEKEIIEDLILKNKLTVRELKYNNFFKASVISAIDVFESMYPRSEYYLYASSLKWDPSYSHFWKKTNYDSLNKLDKDWYKIRFRKIEQNIKDLRSRGCRIYSCTKNSALNSFLQYKDISQI